MDTHYSIVAKLFNLNQAYFNHRLLSYINSKIETDKISNIIEHDLSKIDNYVII